jgi:DNA-directed RNA polymerase subunit RPC12/RpoP
MDNAVRCPHCGRLCELNSLDIGENYVRCSQCFSEFILIIEVKK